MAMMRKRSAHKEATHPLRRDMETAWSRRMVKGRTTTGMGDTESQFFQTPRSTCSPEQDARRGLGTTHCNTTEMPWGVRCQGSLKCVAATGVVRVTFDTSGATDSCEAARRARNRCCLRPHAPVNRAEPLSNWYANGSGYRHISISVDQKKGPGQPPIHRNINNSDIYNWFKIHDLFLIRRRAGTPSDVGVFAPSTLFQELFATWQRFAVATSHLLA